MKRSANGKQQWLQGDEREREIVEEAVRFFSEVGLDGNTRELADRLGITQPLLFRYFPTKEALIARVFEEVFVKRWDPAWDAILDDETLPLRDRLGRFYRIYLNDVANYERIRLFFFIRLNRQPLGEDFLQKVRDQIFTHVISRIVKALRAECGLPNKPISSIETEIAWGLQESIFNLAVRRFVYELAVPRDIERLIDVKIGTFLDGALATLSAHQMF